MSLPLLVRQNSILPFGSQSERPDYDFANDVTLRIYQLDDGQTITMQIPNLRGNTEATFTTTRQDSIYKVHRSGVAKPWQVMLIGIDRQVEAGNAVVLKTPEGSITKLARDVQDVEIVVSE